MSKQLSPAVLACLAQGPLPAQSSVKTVQERPQAGDLTFWQWHFREDVAAQDALLKLRRRYKDEATRDALWSGAWAIRMDVDSMVETARRGGKLLTMFAEGEPA